MPVAQSIGPTGLLATRSVNMVSGDSWPNGDPYLQRQNEPSVAVSTRNTLHLLAGANDYRTVDIPGLSTGPETGDAWLGLFKSFDGGERWQSTLLPGYPQDTSAAGLASPLHGYQAGADAVVRSGTNGLMYFSGLVFNRGENAPSGVFMSRFIDNNNKENGDPIAYLGTTMIDRSTGAEFIDKPWMAVDIPRAGAKTCKVVQTDPAPVVKPGEGKGRFKGWNERARTHAKPNNGKKGETKEDKKGLKENKPYAQNIPAGTIYIAYSRITTVGTDVTSRIMLSSSDDCGATWTKPQQLSSAADKVNQGATIAIDPRSGAVYVAWRQFGLNATDTDSIVVVHSAGKGFDKPAKVHKFKAHRTNEKLRKMISEHRMSDADDVAEIAPFDQGTAEDRFRTNAYPSIAIDDDGRAYLAWTERGYGIARSSDTEGDARVVVSTSRTGAAWTEPRPVDVGNGGPDQPGHQLMPSIAFAAGKLVVVYYDLREDVSRVFGQFVSEKNLVVKRHTIDIRSAYAAKGDVPVFGPSTRVSQYLMGSRPGSTEIEQLQYNPPNLPLFKLGTVPFMGDYIDLAPSPAFVQDRGTWKYNTAAQAAPVFHVVWTDNRDVRPPANGDWTNYTPVKMPGTPGTFDVNQPAPACVPGQTGMRNQNIYSARLTFGLVTGSPGNAKPLDTSLTRGFVVFAQNTSTAVKSYRMTIASQPVGGKASFTQSAEAGLPDPLLSVDFTIPAKSMVTRTVFITSSDPHAQVPVDVQEISAPSMPILAGGLASRVVLNPDISNPDISNPDISNPDISNPDISNAEVYNPDISNPDISNPDISNPDISNPDISNPDISNVVVANPDISNVIVANPDISNPDISNPDISNPDISNPDISNGALSDVTWTIVNTGNTTASFNVDLFLANAAAKLGGVKTQLIVHKTYTTPVADACTLKSQTQTVLVANVPNPVFLEPGTSKPFDPTDPSPKNTTVWLEPGGTSKITLRIIDPDPTDNVTIDPVRDVTPVVTAEPKNTPDVGTPEPPPSTAPPVPDDVHLAFAIAGQPTDTIVGQVIAPVQAHAELNGAPAPGVQVTLAIAANPSGGHLSGTTTLVTDANGNATFSDLSIEKVGIGYRLSASASAFGALPDLSAPFNIVVPPNPYLVTSTADTNTLGTLRYAINAANAVADVNIITFAIAGAGPFTIQPATPLPPITYPVVVDAMTQPGSAAFAPVVTLNGTLVATQSGQTIGQAPGFEILSTNVTIRGFGITSFPGPGVYIASGAHHANTVEDNVITASQFGLEAIYSNTNVIRRNVLSGNPGSGILFVGGLNNTVSDNRIGTTADGLSAMPNGDSGITMYDGTTNLTIDQNVISANAVAGISAQFAGGKVTGLVVTGNTIGRSLDGNVPLPNGGAGISLNSADDSVIGGTAAGAGNAIIGNGGPGISVFNNSLRNAILSNEIDGNGGLGIDLAGNGVTPNDQDDTDAGPNGLQNFPVLTNASNTGATTSVDFALDSASANTNHTVQVFASASCDASGNGEGARLVGSFVRTTDGLGDVLGPLSLTELVPAGQFLTATATDAAGNTSEFSGCLAVTAGSHTAWVAQGPGVVTLNDDGTANGTPSFHYRYDLGNPGPGVSPQTWNFTTLSAGTQSVNIDWHYVGFHAYFAVTARLDVFVVHQGVETIVNTPLVAGPANCCTTPSAGFDYSGSLSINVQAGDTYGFRVTGSNGDSNSVLDATLTLQVSAGPMPAPASALEPVFGAVDQRRDFREHMVGRAIVEEQRRRFTPSR